MGSCYDRNERSGPAWLVQPANLDAPDECRPWQLTCDEREVAAALLCGDEGRVGVSSRRTRGLPRRWRKVLLRMSFMSVRGPDWSASLFGAVAEVPGCVMLDRVDHELLRFVVAAPVVMAAAVRR